MAAACNKKKPLILRKGMNPTFPVSNNFTEMNKRIQKNVSSLVSLGNINEVIATD